MSANLKEVTAVTREEELQTVLDGIKHELQALDQQSTSIQQEYERQRTELMMGPLRTDGALAEVRRGTA